MATAHVWISHPSPEEWNVVIKFPNGVKIILPTDNQEAARKVSLVLSENMPDMVRV